MEAEEAEMKKEYHLEIRCSIRAVTEGGGWTGERLEISEEVKVHAKNFLELCAILSHFHTLTGHLKDPAK
jgi:hypothetical protein